MSAKTTIKVTPRENSGKGVARSLRREGLVPGVIYGHGFETMAVMADAKKVETVFQKSGGHEVLKVEEEGKKGHFDVVIKEVQFHPVTRRLIHIDFQRIKADEEITVKIPLAIEGTAKGVKEYGGILQFGLREVEISCLPKDIPESVTINISELMIHDSIHVSDLDLPPAVKVVTKAEDLIVSVLPPVVIKEEVAGEELEGAEVAGEAEGAEEGAAPSEEGEE